MLDVIGEIAAVTAQRVAYLSSDSSSSRISASCFWESSLPSERLRKRTSSVPSSMQDLVQPRVVINVFHALLARDLVQRRLRDIDEAVLHQLRHLPVEKRQQQRADVRAVHVRIGHDDDLVVAQLFEIERALALAVADARADGGDHRADFVVLKHLVQARLLDVDELAANGQDRLELPVAPLLGRAAGGITLDDESSVFAGSRSEQSASLPGRPPPVSAPLRTVSRALRAASRARAASRPFQ
jgi:hypothetical protein